MVWVLHSWGCQPGDGNNNQLSCEWKFEEACPPELDSDTPSQKRFCKIFQKRCGYAFRLRTSPLAIRASVLRSLRWNQLAGAILQPPEQISRTVHMEDNDVKVPPPQQASLSPFQLCTQGRCPPAQCLKLCPVVWWQRGLSVVSTKNSWHIIAA